MHIVFVAGLPGSGKTRYSDSLVLNEVQRGQTAIALDDLSVLGPEEREARKAHIRKCRPDLVVVADVFFCEERTRERAEALVREWFSPESVAWVFFENNAAQCLENARRRERVEGREVSADIRVLTRRYVIPPGTKTIPVWASEQRDAP
jgi:RecA/RadA recombinase